MGEWICINVQTCLDMRVHTDLFIMSVYISLFYIPCSALLQLFSLFIIRICTVRATTVKTRLIGVMSSLTT